MILQPTFVSRTSRPGPLPAPARPLETPLRLNLTIQKLRLAGLPSHQRDRFQASLHSELLRLASGPAGVRLRSTRASFAPHRSINAGNVLSNTNATRLGALAAQAIFQEIIR